MWQINLDSLVVTGVASSTEFPVGFSLAQNYPNPFNPATTIAFELEQRGHISLTIFDATGRDVVTLVNEDVRAGKHAVTWNGRNAKGAAVSSGVYFYRLRAEGGTSRLQQTRKMVLMK
jgi:hypothetical protein